MDSPHLDRALRLKNNAVRGGVLEHIYMRDVTVGQVADAVLSIDFYYEEGAKGDFLPVVRDVEMLRVTSRKSNYGLYLRGPPPIFRKSWFVWLDGGKEKEMSADPTPTFP